MKIILIFLILFCFSAVFSQKKSFSAEALKDVMINTNGSEATLESVLKIHKSKPVLIYIWMKRIVMQLHRSRLDITLYPA